MKLQQLETLLDPTQIVAPEQNSQYRLEGFPPLPIAYVCTIEQLAEVVRLAAAEDWALIPVGGGTKLDIGNPPRRADLFLCTSQMNSVLEHVAADLTATVEAGCTLGAFQEAIGKHGQFLPLDAPYSDRATVGGVVATGNYGPSRLSLGTVRDWLVGLKVVNADGRVTKAGGKVVKNVAGYDLMKLYTGSFGTLSIIAELNFKLRPRPAAETTLIGIFSAFEPLMEAARLLLESQLAPVALELLSARALRICFPEAVVGERMPALAVRFFGLPEAIEHQCARLPELWRGFAVDLVEMQLGHEGWRWVADFAEHYKHLVSIRVSVLPSQLRSMMSLIQEQLSPLASGLELLAQVGSGIVRAFVDVAAEEIAESLLPQWCSAITALRAFCAREGGSVIIERAPLNLKRQIDVWGEPRSAVKIMRKIKQKLDPNGILSPGRFVAGI